MIGRLRDFFVPKEEIPARAYLTVSALAGIVLAGLWCVLTYGGLVRTDFLPPPHKVAATAGKLIENGSLLKHTSASLTVIMLGFVLSSLVAVPIGILSGSFKVVEAFVEPIVNFSRYLPVSALIPLLILWVGIGMEEKVAVIIIGTFFQQILMIADVSAQVPKDLLDVSYTLGATRRQVITRVLLPAVLPGVIDTLRATMGLAWTYLVVAELVGAFQGLGYLIMSSMRGLATDIIFVAILTIGLLGLFFDQLFKRIRRVVVPWASVR
jgi:NitT/TauT family transport system permease protein